MDIFKSIVGNTFSNGGDQPLNTLLNQLFYVGLAVAVILAIVMIVRGGIEYMTVDSMYSKDSGKKRVQAALGGLLLAFSAILILNTINPKITEFELEFESLTPITPIEVQGVIQSSVAQYSGITQTQYEEMIRTGNIPPGLTPAAQRVLAEALNSVGTLKTGAIPGTDGGNLACAAAVNRMIAAALGQPINNSLSTRDMASTLATSNRFALVGSNYANALPGDIIISPTGARVGHVGIVATAGATSIISNSSSNAEVRANHTAASWDRIYSQDRGLPVLIYRPR